MKDVITLSQTLIKFYRNVSVVIEKRRRLEELFGIEPGDHSMCTTSIHPDVTSDPNQLWQIWVPMPVIC